MKPVIAVSSYIADKDVFYGYGTSGDYIKAIDGAGGIPVQLPTIKNTSDYEQVLRHMDGLLIPGGCDIAPYFFSEQPEKALGRINALIDRQEMELVRLAYDAGIPILGICRGHQVINVAFGGSLYQDIPSAMPEAIGHDQSGCKREELYHKIDIQPASYLHQIFGKDSLYVNSFHHQAVKQLGDGLKTVATAPDGVIEAIEGTGDRFVMGVQFHPENLYGIYTEFTNLFRFFVEECKKRAI
ncbi:MAG TPA: gamma-glutamyl-gamma-aminobutyrate hydrolase family protein [Firmicutes bacterium]|nr:gamma-glutamyl-gamma-aminobutyrate hydrolase family protein [Bacillota bacterium]